MWDKSIGSSQKVYRDFSIKELGPNVQFMYIYMYIHRYTSLLSPDSLIMMYLDPLGLLRLYSIQDQHNLPFVWTSNLEPLLIYDLCIPISALGHSRHLNKEETD